jgi:hypothetical protein
MKIKNNSKNGVKIIRSASFNFFEAKPTIIYLIIIMKINRGNTTVSLKFKTSNKILNIQNKI